MKDEQDKDEEEEEDKPIVEDADDNKSDKS